MKPAPCPGHALRLFCVSAFASFLVLTTAVVSAQVASNPNRAAAENLTKSLIALRHQYQAAPTSAQEALLLQLRATAAKRQQLLSSLIQTSPGEVLRVAIPGTIAAILPPSVQGSVEQETDAQGELEVIYEDGKNSATLHHYIRTGGQSLELKFAADTPTNLLTGSTVRVHGTRIGGTLALASGTGTGSFQVVQAAPLSNTFGAQNTLVILVNFQDDTTQPWTAQNAQSTIFTSASNFWMENSFQQTWLTGEVAGWYTLPIGVINAVCNSTLFSAIATDAQQAAQNAGYSVSNYGRLVYLFPQISGCSWEGLSTIGGNPSSAWVNGLLDQSLVSHELGHSLGLYHSHSMSCGSAVYAPSGCTQYEYGDYYETMGNSNVNGDSMHYNAFQKERLGWLNNSAQPPITTVSSSGSYTLAPYETQDSNPKALKILQSSGPGGNTYYYVESRQAIGFDSILSYNVPGYSNVLSGVVIHIANPGNANGSNLLDMNPGATWGYAMALDVGQSYTDSAAGITIATTSVSGTGATVQITLTSAACALANPAVGISPAQGPWVAAGTPVNFAVTVTDNDSSTCSASTFNVGDTLPTGWSGTWNTSSLTLSPGGSASAALTLTSPAGLANGFYNLTASAANAASPAYNASAPATYVISNTPPSTVSVTTNNQSYSGSASVAISASVMSGGTPLAGAAVSVTVKNPSGATSSASGTTGANGAATVNYHLSRKAPKGTYQVQASSNGASAGTTFIVQ